jgi:hypothetical protein
MSTSTRIIELSRLIAERATELDEYFARHNLPAPSLDASAPASIPIPEDDLDMQEKRTSVIEACEELKALLMGAHELLTVNVTLSLVEHGR